MQVVILAAGLGTRLGNPFPKALTPLVDGRTIMGQQLENIHSRDKDAQVYIVVGFKLDMILEAFPHNLFVYNEMFDSTNTSKSLLRALRSSGPGGVLWLNGDVVFDPRVLDRVQEFIESDQSFVCVNTASVGDEEVKYTTNEAGHINALSKQVTGAFGEAVGINFVAGKDKEALITRLAEVEDQDYFERGIEVSIEKDGLVVVPVDISDLYAVEVDFAEDLAAANSKLFVG